MKLWEVMKKLDENPNKRFKNELGSIIGFADNVLQWLEKDGEIIEPFLVRDRRSGTGICHNTGDDWQLVRQPVTWQEAIQVWADGKKVAWEEDADRRVFDRNKSWPISKYQNHLLDQEGDAVTVRMISGGKWYVED